MSVVVGRDHPDPWSGHLIGAKSEVVDGGPLGIVVVQHLIAQHAGTLPDADKRVRPGHPEPAERATVDDRSGVSLHVGARTTSALPGRIE